RPSSRMIDRFSDGRVLIAGDAAHIHPPTGGQGLNSGLQDMMNLGCGLVPASILSSYNEERHPMIRTMLQLTGHLDTKTRDNMQDGLNRSTDLSMLEINYRWSRIVVDDQ
ncbi:hypothetical protein PUNSTDRAFT_18784, partial [Punctularia strigosozonata HHB-11173 SS5]|uniref:uncharacterized protein n=1 Tax=Punctularia strigosozonata (strain HHB-11173) TaxID=741275 RepID=UPI00044178AE